MDHQATNRNGRDGKMHRCAAVFVLPLFCLAMGVEDGPAALAKEKLVLNPELMEMPTTAG
jgi:hypothetical protein